MRTAACDKTTRTGRFRKPEGELRGTVRLDYASSFAERLDVLDVLHTWGTLTARLQDTTCSGAFGFSFLRAPAESGGALHLRCEDGAVLGARLVNSAEPVPGLASDLRDGWYRAG